MKRQIVTVLLSMMVFAVPVAADPTKKCSLPEFCELYTHRADEISEFEPTSSYYIQDLDTGLMFVTLSAGSAIIDSSSLDINEVYVKIHSSDADDEENTRNVLNFIAAASSLEYGALEERFSIRSPALAWKDIYFDEFSPAMMEAMKEEAFANGDEVLIFSRNYDFYIQYQIFEDDAGNSHEYVWCNMKARDE